MKNLIVAVAVLVSSIASAQLDSISPMLFNQFDLNICQSNDLGIVIPMNGDISNIQLFETIISSKFSVDGYVVVVSSFNTTTPFISDIWVEVFNTDMTYSIIITLSNLQKTYKSGQLTNELDKVFNYINVSN